MYAGVRLYDFESPQLAAMTASSLGNGNPGAVSVCDQGRVLFVHVPNDASQSRVLFDELVR